MKTRIKWIEDQTFMAETPSGHSMVLSSGAANGGKDNCYRPMELLLVGLGGCSSIDVIQILKKARQDVVDCVCNAEAERHDGTPGYFTKIHAEFVVTGRNVQEKHVERALNLSFEKYCSASFMLREKAEITWSYRIEEVD